MPSSVPIAADLSPLVRRLRVRVQGTVQGVGFRPFVFNQATRFGLTGWVLNDGDGVLIEAEGEGVEDFILALQAEPPPLARIDAYAVEEISLQGTSDFLIDTSRKSAVKTSIPADAGVCDACLKELFDPANRHYLYPFINCTHCGPRYTLTHALPYDRPNTTMAAFEMCPRCADAYHDPRNRRFHAQPVACPVCGPDLSMPVSEIVRRLKSGEILAIKGLGGFHIVCDANNETAVKRLRRNKNREEKPFAIMVANIESATEKVMLTGADEALLTCHTRPIVLLDRLPGEGVAPSVAPGLTSLGIMLPYTPLHYLLFHESAGCPDGTEWLNLAQDMALVMTSANPGGEPLVTDNVEAEDRLHGIVDVVVSHNRDVAVRADDSVLRMIAAKPRFIRRARGYVPEPIKLCRPVPPGLAVGGHLKTTVCVTRGREAFVSQHIGDLDNIKTVHFFEETVNHLLGITDVTPQWVAHDLHPDFQSTRFAERFSRERGIPSVAVQHHHAHVAAVMAEHGLEEPVLGLALDGFGLGVEGEHRYWGGEALRVDHFNCQRVGHLAPVQLPGGEAAALAPWRVGAGILHSLGRAREIDERYRDLGDTALIRRMLDSQSHVTSATSLGRLFDGACGLLGVQPVAYFEGQAPMMLEALATAPYALLDTWRINNGVLDLFPLLGRIADMDARDGANAFHGSLVQALSDWAVELSESTGLHSIVLSGGCLMNKVLAEGLEKSLTARGLRPYLPERLPANDGGLCLGQAWVACHHPTVNRRN